MNKVNKGFTLIELLVVIAIIGILAGILFVAINPGAKINDAKDASVKASLVGVPAAATIFYTDNNYSYAGLCADASIAGVMELAGKNCDDSATAWAVEADMLSDDGTKTFCIDSTGAGLEELSDTKGAATTACN